MISLPFSETFINPAYTLCGCHICLTLNAGAFGDVLLASLGHGLIKDLAISFEAVQVRHTVLPQVHDTSRYAAQCMRAPAKAQT